MKKLGIALFIVIVFLVGIFLARNFIIQIVLSRAVNAFTGLRPETGSIDLGIPETYILAQNLKLLNPYNFSDRVMLDMPEIYINYDFDALLSRVMHLREIRLNVKEFVVVKNRLGDLNLNFLKVVKARMESMEEQKKEKDKLPQIQIDLLKLSIGKVVFKDYSVNISEPIVKEFNININEQFENITDPYALSSLIIVKALTKTSIASLVNFDLSEFQKEVENIAYGAVAAAKDNFEKVGSGAQKAVENVTKTLGETSKGLKETFNLPFGK